MLHSHFYLASKENKIILKFQYNMDFQPVLKLFSKIYGNTRLLLLLIFLFSLSVSLIFLVFFGDVGPSQHRLPGSDYTSCYKPFALDIMAGRGAFFDANLKVCAPPGYPMFLTAVLSSAQLFNIDPLDLIIVFNAFFTALSACLLYLIAKSLFSQRIALIASFLWLSYPFNQWFIKNPNTEGPFIFLLYLGLWTYIQAYQKRKFSFIFFSGIIFGFAALIRPISLLIPFFLALLVFFLAKEATKRIKFLLALTIVSGFLLSVAPWEIRLFSVTGKIVPITTAGSEAMVDGLTSALKIGEGGDKLTVSEDVTALMQRIKTANLNNETGVVGFMMKEFKQNPLPVIKLFTMKMGRTWYATGQKWYEKQILAVQLFYLLSALFGLVLGMKIHRDKIGSFILPLIIILYFWGMTVTANSIMRYMVPVMGLVFIFSAIFFDYLLNKFLKKYGQFNKA